MPVKGSMEAVLEYLEFVLGLEMVCFFSGLTIVGAQLCSKMNTLPIKIKERFITINKI